MRIHIHKDREGLKEVLVVPHRRAHLAPVRVSGHNHLAVMEELLAVITEVADKEPKPHREASS